MITVNAVRVQDAWETMKETKCNRFIKIAVKRGLPFRSAGCLHALDWVMHVMFTLAVVKSVPPYPVFWTFTLACCRRQSIRLWLSHSVMIKAMLWFRHPLVACRKDLIAPRIQIAAMEPDVWRQEMNMDFKSLKALMPHTRSAWVIDALWDMPSHQDRHAQLWVIAVVVMP